MDTLEAIILGIVQGLTEFLPVSSTGHLVIGQKFLGLTLNQDAMLTFGIVVHGATVMATITALWSELSKLVKGGLQFKYNDETKYILKIALSMLPVMVVGFFFKDTVEDMLGEGVPLVGAMLLVTAALLLFSHFFRPQKSHSIGYKDAFIIGISQAAAAILPGLSRSGTTISTGLLLGNERTQLAKFSFLMVLVPILGEAFLELIKGGFSPAASGISTITLIAGFVAAYISGLFACKVMIRIVSRGKLYWFAIYCVIIGMAAIIFG